MKIAPMTNEHSNGVMSIFNQAIQSGWAAFPENPLPIAAFEMIFKLSQNYPALVLVDDADQVMGFGFLRAYHPLPVFKRSAELSYFLSPHIQRMGFGSMLLLKLEELGKGCGVSRLIATVCEKNSGSIAFHKKRGFQECGRFTDIGERKGELFSIVLFEKGI